MDDQSSIGWDQIFKGRISKKWKQAQQLHYTRIGSLRSAEYWTSCLIQRLYKFPWEFWELRKATLQDPSTLLNKQWLLELNNRIAAEFQTGSTELRSKDRRWFKKSLEMRLCDTMEAKTQWLEQVSLARIRTRAPNVIPREADIRRYFHPE